MSTTYGIFKSGGTIILNQDDELPEYYRTEEMENEFIEVARMTNGGDMVWKNELAPFLPSNMKVYPLDNTAQGIYTIGDIKAEMSNDNK